MPVEVAEADGDAEGEEAGKDGRREKTVEQIVMR